MNRRNVLEARLASLDADVTRLLAENGRLRVENGVLFASLELKGRWITAALRYLADMAHSVGQARRASDRRGGQHVPYHGDYCAAPPSALATIERQVRELRGLLGDDGG